MRASCLFEKFITMWGYDSKTTPPNHCYGQGLIKMLHSQHRYRMEERNHRVAFQVFVF